ncbi:MAG: hypothetical protein IJ685_02535 [Selenomonadaceae bacterium]|nr:hypothetical protein [Selenomonadaceae bacterium]
MKKFFRRALTAIFIVALMISATTAQAIERVPNEKEILADMYAHPSNYIYYGGASTGLSFFIVRNSLNVELYNPPNYIISVRGITRFDSGKDQGILSEHIIRYKYDYTVRKMYMERQDQNKNVSWEYLEPVVKKGVKSYLYNNFVAAGEVLFYIAYKKSFYDKPLNDSFKNFLAKEHTR